MDIYQFVTILASLLGAFLVSYFTEKGKQSAINDNLEKLTTTVEGIKSSFDMAKLTHQIQYSKLHERRAAVIETFYEKMTRLQNGMRALTAAIKFGTADSFEEDEKVRKKEVAEAFNEFNKLYLEKRLFFKTSERVIIEDIVKDYVDKVVEYAWPQQSRDYNMTPEQRKLTLEKSQAASKYIAEEIPKKIDQLEVEFHKTLGMDK